MTKGVPLTAQPAHETAADDPVEILRLLPEKLHENFLADYRDALNDARRPEQYHELHDLLRLWRLRAIAYSNAGYEDRGAAAREGTGDFVPVEKLVPDWPSR